MKRVIALALLVVLTGCDQTTDTDTPDRDGTISSANITDAGGTWNAGQAPDSLAEGPKAQVFQFGIYKATRKGQIKESTETNTGKVVRKPTLEHVLMTDRIPLTKDTYFGFQYRLWNLPTEVTIKRVMELRSVLIHPEMALPDGSRSTGWDRSIRGIVKSQQVLGFDGYAFNEDYELVEGDWIFQIWYQDKKLIERKFVSALPELEKAAESTEKE